MDPGLCGNGSTVTVNSEEGQKPGCRSVWSISTVTSHVVSCLEATRPEVRGQARKWRHGFCRCDRNGGDDASDFLHILSDR